jgi:uncharacterized protein
MRQLIVLLMMAATLPLNAQTLVRKAIIGIFTSEKEGRLVTDSVAPASTASMLGVQKNDLLISINDQTVNSSKSYNAIASEIRAGDLVSIAVQRKGKTLRLKGAARMKPLESSTSADLTYDWVPFRGGYLRTIVRKPRVAGKVPAILLIPGYGCGSIEQFSKGYNGHLIDEWIRSGFAVVTIEKSGLGDSYGCVPCAEADLATDIESFTAGYRYMERLDFVDADQLYIWGHSLGGMIAPEIAKNHNPRGVMVFGTVFRPWSEFLPEMHRVQKPLLEGKGYRETERFTRLIHKVYYEFFVLRKTREELYLNPEYRDIVVSELEYKPGDNNMWGRHWRFWQQIDSLNLAESWSLVDCPVLVINGGSDYEQCAAIEPLLIEQAVNAAHPGKATRVQIEDLDHFMMKSGDYREAVDNFRNKQFYKGNFNSRLAAETVSWLNKQTGKS